MWPHSTLESLNLSSFRSRTRRGRCPTARKLFLDPLEERTLLSSVQAVHPLFGLSAVTTSPFPSDRFTVADTSQNTGLRVNLPIDPTTMSDSDIEDTQVINTLDGFNLQPRLSIPFSGPIDVNSVISGPIDANSISSHDIFLVSLGDTLPGGDKGGEVVGINQIVWDPDTNTLHVQSDQLLDQHTRYALIVTNGVLDTSKPQGQPVQASEDFTRFRHNLNFGQTNDPVLKDYRKDLLDAMAAARQVGVPESDIVVASVFTTQSATAVLEKIRHQIDAATPAPANFDIGSNGEHTVFSLSDGTSINLRQDRGKDLFTSFTDAPLYLNVIPGAVGQIAYGMYVSPDYEVHPGEYIKPVATRTGMPEVQGSNEIYFTLVLPYGTKPADGWPVAIFGHGGGNNKDGIYGVPAVAAELAAKGIATIGINAVGHGFGPGGTITVTQSGVPVTLNAGGRAIDQNGNKEYLSTEGASTRLDSEWAIIDQRDARIQTTADLMQLVRVIEVGVDVDPKERNGIDLDPSRIYFAGVSQGSFYGAAFLAVEPSVSAGVLNVVGGPFLEHRRLDVNRAGSSSGGATVADVLKSREPSLINASVGITQLDGLTVSGPDYFNEDMPLRDGFPLTVVLAGQTTPVTIRSPVVDPVPGAMALQEFFDHWEWVSQPGNPVAYAPHLRKDPLPGVPAKSVIVQFAKGDQFVVNPTATAFLRAGDLADRATYYRYDLAFPGQPTNTPPAPGAAGYPHTFAGLITNSNPTIKRVALAAENQIATFFASEGTQIIQPQPPDGFGLIPEEFFEGVDLPITGGLPEGLNYSGSAPAGAAAQVSGNQAAVTIPTDATSGMVTATSVPAGNPLLPTVRATSGSTSAARAVPQAARAGPVPQAGPSAIPTSPPIDLTIDALPPLGWLDSALDDLAAGLLRPARRRH